MGHSLKSYDRRRAGATLTRLKHFVQMNDKIALSIAPCHSQSIEVSLPLFCGAAI